MKMKRERGLRIVGILLMLTLLAFSFSGCSKEAAEKPEVKAADVAENSTIPEAKFTFAAPHTPPQTYAVVDVAFIDHIKEVSGGKIDLVYYPGGTLIGGREAASELKAGAADFGWPRVGYSQHGYKLFNSSLIWMYNIDPVNDTEAELKIYKKLYEREEMNSEFDGIFPYGANASGSTAWLFTNTPIKSLDDIKGKMIRANASWAKVVQALGGVPVNVPMSELYLALDKGTVDGVLGLPGTVIKGENLGEVIEYAMDIKLNQTPYYAWAFNEKTWSTMPSEVRDVFIEEEPWLERRVIEQQQSEIGPSIEFGKSLGVNFIEISDSDLNRLYGIMDDVCRANCAVLDAEGYAATKMYEYTQELVKEHLAAK